MLRHLTLHVNHGGSNTRCSHSLDTCQVERPLKQQQHADADRAGPSGTPAPPPLPGRVPPGGLPPQALARRTEPRLGDEGLACASAQGSAPKVDS